MVAEAISQEPALTRNGVFDLDVCVPADWADEQIEDFAESACRCGDNGCWKVKHERTPCNNRDGFVHLSLTAVPKELAVQLDPKTCPIGTKGWLAICVEDFTEEPDWVKEPTVVLNENREWVSINPQPLDYTLSAPDGAIVEKAVFSDWQSAVRSAIERDRAEANAMIAEANEILDRAKKAEQLLNDSQP